MSLEQMRLLGLDNSAYVWHSGLADWVKITQVPELNEMLLEQQYGQRQVVTADPIPSLPVEEPAQEAPAVPAMEDEAAAPAVPAVEDEAAVPAVPAEEEGDALEPAALPAQEEPAAANPVMGEPVVAEPAMAAAAQPVPQYQQYQQNPVQAPKEEIPECPPTNLVWAIIITILCCMPLGIVAIVLAVLTKQHYNNGNYEKAKRYSEWGAWVCIFAIILGLILSPIACSQQIMQMPQF